MDALELVVVGKIVNTHGLRGEVRIMVETDFSEIRFAQDNVLYLKQIDSLLKLTIERCKPYKKGLLLKFVEWNDISEVEPYKGSMLHAPRIDSSQLETEADEYLYHQIIGCTVVTLLNEQIGKIVNIMSLPANDVWVVSRLGKPDLLLPFIAQVVKEIDVERKQIIIEWMEGLE